jgi:hypothetical protein
MMRSVAKKMGSTVGRQPGAMVASLVSRCLSAEVISSTYNSKIDVRENRTFIVF